jgi:hypothetical protein
VDHVDTCVYVSKPYSLQPGGNTISLDVIRSWSGTIYCDYYLWAYNPSRPRLKAAGASFSRLDRSSLLLHDAEGKPLPQPVLYGAPRPLAPSGETRITRGKWTIGNDPDDAALEETTGYTAWPDHGRIAIDPGDRCNFFTQSIKPGALVLQKWRWMPNGDALLQTDWGENGSLDTSTSISSILPCYSGPVCCGSDYLLFTNSQRGKTGDTHRLCFLDGRDGSLIKELDVSDTWRDKYEYQQTEPFAPGIGQRQGFNPILLASPASCLMQLIDPYCEDDSHAVKWENGNGDYFGDKNFAPEVLHPWVCHDSAVPSYADGTALDANMFAFSTASGPNLLSFTLFAPDGTGGGCFPYPGLARGRVYGLQVVDTGAAYDGLYFGGTSADGDSAGVWYMGYNTCKGCIDFHSFYEDAPCIMFGIVPSGTILAGKEYSVAWYNDGASGSWLEGAVRLDFSADGGATWTTVEDSLHVSLYQWKAPNISSSRCRLRITKLPEPARHPSTQISREFAIAGPIAVADEPAPRTFITVSNHPNPFNPLTTISFTLLQAGRISIEVHDVTGRLVGELARGFYPAGTHAVVWDARDRASGVYFCTLKAGWGSVTRKMLLVR